MKSKFVFVFEDENWLPLDMDRCYIFDNLIDAQSFFNQRNLYLDVHGDSLHYNKTVNKHGRFSVHNDAKTSWNGEVFVGKYA